MALTYLRQSLHLSSLIALSAEVGVQPGFIAWIDGYGRYTAVPVSTYTIDGLHVITGQDSVQWADDSNFSGGSGSQGPQGVQGNQGVAGSQGVAGAGVQGNQGNQGVAGVQGTNGVTGATGSTGSRGATGSRGFGGDTGPTGDVGVSGAAGLGIEPDVKWPKILTTGGAASATLATFTPSTVILPNNAEANISIRVEVWEPGDLSIRGEWEFEALLARISNSFALAGVVDISNANDLLPVGFGVALQIDATNGLFIQGNPAANNAYWAISVWVQESTALDVTGGTSANTAPLAPQVSITSPSTGYAWVSGDIKRITGTQASTNARVYEIKVYDGYDGYVYLGDAVLGSNGNWESEITVPSAGNISLVAKAITIVGNDGYSVAVNGTSSNPDVTAPVVTAFTLPTEVTSYTIDVLSFTATDTESATIYYQATTSSSPPDHLDGNWVSSPLTTLIVDALGTYTFYPWAMDLSGNVSTVFGDPRVVQVNSSDVTAPVITTFTIPANAASRTISISTLTATDDVGVTGYAITEDTAAVPSLGSFGAIPPTITAGSDGSHIYRAYARDAAGNISTAQSASCVVDTVSPVVTSFTIPSLSTSRTISITTLTATDAIGVTGYAITEDTAVVPSLGSFGSIPATITAGSDGYHTYRAYARDAAGNISSAVIDSCGVDTDAPSITSFVLATTSSSVSVSITTLTTNETPAGWFLSETGTIPSEPTWLTEEPVNFTVGGSGLRTVYLWIRDVAGNVSTRASSTSTVTLSDVTAPVMTAFAVPSTSDSLTITLTTSPAATDAIGVTGYAVTIDTVTVPDLSAFALPTPTTVVVETQGFRTLRAYARDAAGNISTPMSGTCTVSVADTTAPVMTAFAVPATSSSLTITLDAQPAATDGVGVTGYSITEDTSVVPNLSTFALPSPTSFIVSADGYHVLRAYARDSAGNISAPLSGFCTADGVSPTMTGFVSPAISTSLTITFDTVPIATDSIGVTGYVVTDNTAVVPSLGSFSSSSPTFIIVGTQGSHTLRAYARDAAGNISSPISSITSVDTAAPTITAFTMPSTATSLTVSISSWTATDEVGVTGWIIVTDSAVVPGLGDGYWTGSAWSSVVCTTEGAHSFYAYTRDAAGHISSPATQSTTITLPDVIAPVITAFTIPSTSGITISISSLSATDAIGVTGYVITEDTAVVPSLGAFGYIPSTITAGADGYHTYRAYARDSAGNISNPVTQTCTVSNAVTPTISAFVIPTASRVLASIPISTFTTTNDPTEYAVVVQAASASPPSTPSSGWSGTVPTTITCSGSADGYFTAYIWCRNTGGTSNYASSSVLVLQTNATSLSLVSVLSSSTARVTFHYAFDTSAEANDWPVSGATARTVTGGVLQVTGTAAYLRTVAWAGLSSRAYADSLIQLESATATTSSADTNTLGNLVFGHSNAYAGNPYNPNPGLLLAKRIFDPNYEIDVNGVDNGGGTNWTPAVNTLYDFTYTLSTTSLTVAASGHGSYTLTGTYSLAGSAGHVSFGPYSTNSNWADITLTGIVSF